MKPSKERREVFQVHAPRHFSFGVRESACELLSLFLADKAVHQLMAKHYFEGIVLNYADYREERIVQLLIAIAAAYRLTSWHLSKEDRKKEDEKWVGMLFRDGVEEGARITMHEACNKIIHADEIAFRTRKLPRAEFAYIKEDLLASGRKGKEAWTAGIWIAEFCDAALTMPEGQTDLPF